MNITKLERLIAVYEAGSFRKAAKAIGISQPALTWSIRQLEESLNLPLFVRGPRGIKPTEPCERLIVRARLIVSEQGRLLAEVERSNRVQTIELGVHPILANRDFARALAQFRQAHDDVTIQIVDGDSAQLQERLRQGSLDLAICAAAAQTAHEGEFDFEALQRQSYSVFAAADHPIFAEMAAGMPISAHGWAQVAVPNVLAEQTGSDNILQMLEGVGMTSAKAVIRSPSMQLIRTLVENGGLLGMLPDDLVHADGLGIEMTASGLRRVPGTQMDAPPLGLLTVAGSYQSRALRKLMSILRLTFRRTLVR